MNEALALDTAPNVASTGADDLQALLGLPSKRRSAEELPNAAAEFLKGVTLFIDSLLLKAITTRTAVEFKATRDEVWLPYAKTVLSISKLVRLIVPTTTIDTVLHQSFSEIEAEFRDYGSERFGTATKDQAIFTVFTLRRTSRLISRVATVALTDESAKEKDQRLLSSFTFFATWTEFHLDCLLLAIRRNQEISLDIMPEIIDGLRAAVNAYGFASEALDLRPREQDPIVQAYAWDDEDQVLLDSSMGEMGNEFSEVVWDEAEAARRSAEIAESQIAGKPLRPASAFGTHIREATDIIRDWIEHPKAKQ